MGSATGGKHVSAISHSSILPIENLNSRNRDRSLKENAPSGLRNRILTISDLKILNQNASGIFQYSLSQSPLWLLASKYSERILSQSSLWLCFQLPSLSLPCSSEPILKFQLQALVPISCIRMQTFSALNVRSHQRRKFSSLTFAYSDDHVLKLTGAQTFEFQPAPPTQRIRKSLPPSYSSFVATSVTLGSSRRPALKRPNASTTSDSGRLATRCSSAPVCRPVCSALPLSYEAPASPAPPQGRDPQ